MFDSNRFEMQKPPVGALLCTVHFLYESKIAEAEKTCQRITALAPKYAPALYWQGMIELDSKAYEKALSSLNLAIHLDGQSATFFLGRALVFAALGKPAKALEDCNVSIEIDPDWEFSYFRRALLYCQMGETDLAYDDFSRAIALDTDFIEAYFQHGLMCLKLGNLTQAVSKFDEVLLRAPNHRGAHLAKLKALFKLMLTALWRKP
ncbi:MAG: tetratricopeptide repeat protein [Burkholderiales bacterium]|jgi:tetratricopeptide (TPR) repeat protein|nr:tetratricopeptide repeat protein [Burkholderiales bacterium]